jgi:hypothetical protein
MVLTRRPSSIISLYEAKVEDFLNAVKRERGRYYSQNCIGGDSKYTIKQWNI